MDGFLKARGLLNLSGAVLVASALEKPPWKRDGVEWLTLPTNDSKRVDLAALMSELARRAVNEIHVEAGPTLSGALLEAGLVDELLVYQAPVLLGQGAAMLNLPGMEKIRSAPPVTAVRRTSCWSGLALCLPPFIGLTRSGSGNLLRGIMFTGIIQSIGTVASIASDGQGARLRIDCPDLSPDQWHQGDSIAVAGCCLTALNPDRQGFEADLSSETLERTSLGQLDKGSPVNLEPALAMGDRLGGHWVTGHIDGSGRAGLDHAAGRQ